MVPATAEAVSRHLDEAKRRYAHNTVKHRRPLLVRLADAHAGDLFSLTADDLDRWLDAAQVTNRTRNVYIGNLATFYRWALKRGYTESDPTIDATRLQAPRYLPRPARGADIDKALAAATPRMRAWLCLMAYAGARCCEVGALHVEDLLWHLDPPTIHFRHDTKRGNERLVPIARVTEQALLEYGLPRAGAIFRRAGTVQPVSAAYVSKTTCTYLDELGIRATPHMLRHFFATTFYGETLDIRATQAYMGHVSPATTAVYAQFAASEASAVVRRLGSAAAEPALFDLGGE